MQGISIYISYCIRFKPPPLFTKEVVNTPLGVNKKIKLHHHCAFDIELLSDGRVITMKKNQQYHIVYSMISFFFCSIIFTGSGHVSMRTVILSACLYI